MRTWTDDEKLEIGLELTDEPQDLDLTDGTGAKILDAAVEGMLSAAQSARGPDGTPWPDDAPSTLRRKGHGLIGYKTGRMMDPSNWTDGPREVTPRVATWRYDGPDYAGYFHRGKVETGQPPRPIIGWTDQADDLARRAIEDMVLLADAGPEVPTP